MRIGVVAGYMPFFDEIMPPGYAADRERFGSTAAGALKGLGEVTYLGLVRDKASGAEIGRQLKALAPDAVLVVPTMATPAGYLWNVLEPNPNLPVVLWAAHETTSVPPDYDMVELCRHSSNVGVLMIGNILSRHGRPFTAIVGPRDRADIQGEVREAVTTAALAGSLKRARIGRIGRPLDGYDNVDVDAAALKAAIGCEIVDIALEEWEDACLSVTPAQKQAVIAATGRHAQIEHGKRPHDLSAASAMAAALEVITERHGLAAGALNCRDRFGVTNPRIASLGCLAVTHATTRGIPFACTGDVITAIAMLIGKRLGGAALYCELDAIDEPRDAFLCSNTGEGDFDWLPRGGLCRVFASGNDSGRVAPGCSVRQHLKPGPATMLGFSPKARAENGFVLIAMEGEALEPPDVALSVTSAWFRAQTRPMRQAMRGWIEAGATHHGSLSPGHLAKRFAMLGRYLGIGMERI